MNKRGFAILLLGMMLLSTYRVSAMALARFPDSSRLQPIPSYVQPNVSGNVNASLSVSTDTTDTLTSPDQSGQTNNTSGTVQSPSTDQSQTNATFIPWIIAGGVIILLVLLFLFLLSKF
jgi:hypothetical protein